MSKNANKSHFQYPLYACSFNEIGAHITKALIKPVARFALYCVLTAAWLAQLGEHRSAEREVVGSNPGRTNTQGL